MKNTPRPKISPRSRHELSTNYPRSRRLGLAQARKCEKGHSSHCDCADLTVVGQTAQASKDASNAVLVPTPVQFANFCSGALCSAENYASLSNPGLSNPSFPGSGTPPTPGVAPITPPAFPPVVIVPALGLAGILGASGALTQPSSVSP